MFLLVAKRNIDNDFLGGQLYLQALFGGQKIEGMKTFRRGSRKKHESSADMGPLSRQQHVNERFVSSQLWVTENVAGLCKAGSTLETRDAGGNRTHFDRVATGCLAIRLQRRVVAEGKGFELSPPFGGTH